MISSWAEGERKHKKLFNEEAEPRNPAVVQRGTQNTRWNLTVLRTTGSDAPTGYVHGAEPVS